LLNSPGMAGVRRSELECRRKEGTGAEQRSYSDQHKTITLFLARTVDMVWKGWKRNLRKISRRNSLLGFIVPLCAEIVVEGRIINGHFGGLLENLNMPPNGIGIIGLEI